MVTVLVACHRRANGGYNPQCADYGRCPRESGFSQQRLTTRHIDLNDPRSLATRRGCSGGVCLSCCAPMQRYASRSASFRACAPISPRHNERAVYPPAHGAELWERPPRALRSRSRRHVRRGLGSLRASWCSAIEFVAWRYPTRRLARAATSARTHQKTDSVFFPGA